jgi:hypothetical protein
VVQVIFPGQPTRSLSGRPPDPTMLGPPTFKYFNVAIASSVKAAAATVKYIGELDHSEIGVVRALSSKEVEALRLDAGGVAPA